MFTKRKKKIFNLKCQLKFRRYKGCIFFIGILLFIVLQISYFISISNSTYDGLTEPVKEKGLRFLPTLPVDGTSPQNNKGNLKHMAGRLNRLWGNIKRQAVPRDIQPPPGLSFEAPNYVTETKPPRIRHKIPKMRPAVVQSTPNSKPNNKVEYTNTNLSNSERPHEKKDSPISLGAEPFSRALETFYLNLLNKTPGGNPEQLTQNFTDIEAGPGVVLPYDPHYVEDPALWQACDPRNSSFSVERDKLCQKYLTNLNNIRYIQSMSSKLLAARTIKMKLHYAHGNLSAIVKISQYNFFYEAASEKTAYAYDRVLNFGRLPITSFMALPLDFMRAAAAHSPLLSQWLHRHVILYNETRENFVDCKYYDYDGISAYETLPKCAMVSVQVWMKDVHDMFDTFLALPFRYDEKFENKYYVPGDATFREMRRARLRAIGELQDCFIFDFITGNTDRGMEGHNNFVYGGCSAKTECVLGKPEDRQYGLAKFAYLDQGSSFHSYKEPDKNPFFGALSGIRVCRFRKSTYENLKRYESRVENAYPLLNDVEKMIENAIYKVIYASVLQKTQTRLNKIVSIVENCLTKFPEKEVFSIPDYDKVRIAEEDATLDDD